LRLRSASDGNVSDIKESMIYSSIEIGTESCRSGMKSQIFWNILAATDASELAKKQLIQQLKVQS
jgi:hypothetical protein